MLILRFPKGSNEQIKENFNLTTDGFDCKCNNEDCTHTYVSMATMDFIQEMRTDLGYPMTFNSGYRCPVHNKAEGGASYSQHIFGIAVDIRPVDNDPKKLHEIHVYATGALPDRGGIAKYKSFVHIDLREKKAMW